MVINMELIKQASVAEISQIRKRIINLAWPSILEMILHMTVWMVDTAMVGRLGAVAISAVGLGGQLFFNTVFIFSAIGVGTTALVSRSIGAGDKEKAANIGRQSLVLAWVIGILLFVGYNFLVDPILSNISIAPEVRGETEIYLKTLLWAALFMPPMIVCNAILRGSGNTKIPMFIAAIANFSNIILDAILIFGLLGFPVMGVKGAAIAAVIGQALGALVVHYLLFSGHLAIKIDLKDIFKLDYQQIKRVTKISLPAAFEELVHNGGYVIGSFILATMGTVPFAAQQIAAATESLSFMPGFGFAIACTTLVGQSLGAKDIRTARLVTIEAAKMAMIVMGTVGVLFFAIPSQLTGVFTTDRDVINIAAICIRIAAFEQLFIAASMVMAGCLRGSGDTRWPLLTTAIGFWGFRLPMFYVMVFLWKLPIYYVWVVMVIDWSIRTILLYTRFKSGKWTQIQV